MKRNYKKCFPIVGLDFVPEKEVDIDILQVDEEQNHEPASKRLKEGISAIFLLIHNIFY